MANTVKSTINFDVLNNLMKQVIHKPEKLKTKIPGMVRSRSIRIKIEGVRK